MSNIKHIRRRTLHHHHPRYTGSYLSGLNDQSKNSPHLLHWATAAQGKSNFPLQLDEGRELKGKTSEKDEAPSESFNTRESVAVKMMETPPNQHKRRQNSLVTYRVT